MPQFVKYGSKDSHFKQIAPSYIGLRNKNSSRISVIFQLSHSIKRTFNSLVEVIAKHTPAVMYITGFMYQVQVSRSIMYKGGIEEPMKVPEEVSFHSELYSLLVNELSHVEVSPMKEAKI